MRSLRVIVFLLISAVSAYAQIPNPGFENWTSGEPDGWITNNSAPDFVPLTQVSTAHGGTSAIRGVAIDIGFGMVMGPMLWAGQEGVGFPFTSRPAALNLYYQFSPVGADRISFSIALYKGGEVATPIGVGGLLVSAAAASFSPLSIPINYGTADSPDSAIITVMLVGETQFQTVHAGSFFILDDVAFGSAVGVEDDRADVPATMKLDQNYPNPFNPSTSIGYQLDGSGYATLKVFDMLGKEVATLVDGVLEAGAHVAVWDAADFPSGVYAYRLTVTQSTTHNVVTRSGRMVLAR